MLAQQRGIEGRNALDKVVPQLGGDFEIDVVGNTDDVPVGREVEGRYASNWELAAERAVLVVRHLQGRGVYPGLPSCSGGSTASMVASPVRWLSMPVSSIAREGEHNGEVWWLAKRTPRAATTSTFWRVAAGAGAAMATQGVSRTSANGAWEGCAWGRHPSRAPS